MTTSPGLPYLQDKLKKIKIGQIQHVNDATSTSVSISTNMVLFLHITWNQNCFFIKVKRVAGIFLRYSLSDAETKGNETVQISWIFNVAITEAVYDWMSVAKLFQILHVWDSDAITSWAGLHNGFKKVLKCLTFLTCEKPSQSLKSWLLPAELSNVLCAK